MNNSGDVVPGNKPHLTDCYHKQCVEVPEDRKEEVGSSGDDYTSEMRKFVEELAVKDTAKLVSTIWQETCTHFRELGGPNFWGITKATARNLIYNTRQKAHGGDAIKKVETEYCGPSASSFVRSSSQFVDKKGSQRQMCFAVPELLKLLSYPNVSGSFFVCTNCVFFFLTSSIPPLFQYIIPRHKCLLMLPSVVCQ